MRTLKVHYKAILAVLISLILAVALAGCESGDSGAVAATVNGEEILERTVTEKIMKMRNSSETYKDDIIWATALYNSGTTPEALRKQTIDAEAVLVVTKALAAEYGIVADNEWLDQHMADARQTIGGDDAEWASTLERHGYSSEAEYRDSMVIYSLQMQLMDVLTNEPTEEEFQAYAVENASAYAGKRSTAIILSPMEGQSQEDIDALAADIQKELDNGTDFDTLVQQHAAESAAGASNGDMGWSSVAQLDPAYAQALDDMAIDEVQKVSSESGTTFFIKCTEVFEPSAGQIDYAQIPQGIIDIIRSNWNVNTQVSGYQTAIDERVEAANIVINPMPEGLPYYVDMSLAVVSDLVDPNAQPENPAEPTEEPTEAPAPDYSSSGPEAVQAAIDAGLVIEDVVVGEGLEATPGSTVKLNYNLFLEDGTPIESNQLTFVLGGGSVIPGWSTGIPGMKVGGQRNLTIPPSYAYGEQGQGDIPPNATLRFELELVEVVPAQ
jgi:foldase protein PrsA